MTICNYGTYAIFVAIVFVFFAGVYIADQELRKQERLRLDNELKPCIACGANRRSGVSLPRLAGYDGGFVCNYCVVGKVYPKLDNLS